MGTRGTAEPTLPRKTPGRTKKSPTVSRPAASPQLASQLERLVEVVTQADEARREQAVSHVLKNCIPQVVALLCERLARRLGGLPGARAALVRIGRAALPRSPTSYDSPVAEMCGSGWSRWRPRSAASSRPRSGWS